MANRYISKLFKSGEEFEAFLEALDNFKKGVSDGTVTVPKASVSGAIATIKGTTIKIYYGTKSGYNSLTESEKKNLYPIITDDTTITDINAAITSLNSNLSKFKSDLSSGAVTVAKAESATNATNATNASYATRAVSANKATTADSANLASSATYAGKANADHNGAVIDSTYLHLGVKNAANMKLLRGSATTPLNVDDLLVSGSFALMWDDVKNGYVTGLPSYNITGGYAANLYVSNDYNETNSTMKTAYQLLELRATLSYGNSNMLVFHRYYTGESWSNWLRFISAEEVEAEYLKKNGIRTIKETSYNAQDYNDGIFIGRGVVFSDVSGANSLLDDNSLYLIRYGGQSFTLCTTTKPQGNAIETCYSSDCDGRHVEYGLYNSGNIIVGFLSIREANGNSVNVSSMKITKIASMI